MTTPATIHLVSALRGCNTSTVEAANILDTWLNERLTGLVDVLTEIVRNMENMNAGADGSISAQGPAAQAAGHKADNRLPCLSDAR